jgi:hypothetical protein
VAARAPRCRPISSPSHRLFDRPLSRTYLTKEGRNAFLLRGLGLIVADFTDVFMVPFTPWAVLRFGRFVQGSYCFGPFRAWAVLCLGLFVMGCFFICISSISRRRNVMSPNASSSSQTSTAVIASDVATHVTPASSVGRSPGLLGPRPASGTRWSCLLGLLLSCLLGWLPPRPLPPLASLRLTLKLSHL